MTSFYSEKELHALGLKSIGKNIFLSRKASIYLPETISIGNNVRIDDFCVLSGKIVLGNNIHISAYCALYGANGIELKGDCGISPQSIIFSAMDDFLGDYLIGPVYPSSLTNVTGGKVVMERFTQLGANTIVFPNIIIKEGAVTGAMTLVNKNLEEWTINTGIPVNKSRPRRKGLLDKVKILNGGGYNCRVKFIQLCFPSVTRRAA